MRKLAAVLVLAASCSGPSPWVNRARESDLPPPPPERVRRNPPDFRLRDDASRREYLLYRYEDAAVREEFVVTAPYDGPEGPRLATRQEHDRAMALFAAEWKSRGDEARLRYFNELHERELRRTATQLDQQIFHAREAKRQLEEERLALAADLGSRKDTNTFEGGSEKLSLVSSKTLEQEIARKDRDLAIASTHLAILQYKRSLRDGR